MNHPKNLETALKWDYKFWNTQPVVKLNEIVTLDGQIEPDKPIENVNTSIFELPPDFEWCTFDLSNKDECTLVATFLDKYYVEDSEHTFRLHYTSDFIQWIYDNQSKNIAIGVRVRKNNMIVGFICGKLTKVQVNKNKLDLIEVNLLCIHPHIRNKKLAPVLIKELTRRFNLLGYSKALYTSSNYLPTPVLTANYYHKAINVQILHDTGFIKLDKKTILKNVKKAHKLPETFTLNGFKKMELKHLDQMYDLFNTYMDKYNLHPIFTKDEFSKLFYNNKFVVCYVIENEDGNVTDFASYYIMQSRVLKNNEKHEFIRQANLYYYTSLNETPYTIVRNLLIVARNTGIDVFNATDIMENATIVRELGFEPGTGLSNYYLYNWKIKSLKTFQCSLLLM